MQSEKVTAVAELSPVARARAAVAAAEAALAGVTAERPGSLSGGRAWATPPGQAESAWARRHDSALAELARARAARLAANDALAAGRAREAADYRAARAGDLLVRLERLTAHLEAVAAELHGPAGLAPEVALGWPAGIRAAVVRLRRAVAALGGL